jgi:hypothetical protein
VWTSTSSPGRPRQALPPRKRRLAPARLLPVLFFLVLGLSGPAVVSASEADDYTNAIHRALALVQFAERGDVPSRQQAITVLVQGTGNSQPEVLSDLRAEPPDLTDADQRLQALYSALQARVDTPDPGQARQRLHQILAMPRYAGLATGPSLLDQVITALLRAIAAVLSWLGLNRAHIPTLLWLALALLALAAVVLLTIRGGFSRGGKEARQRRTAPAPRLPVDFFADADLLASTGDYLAAIRALAGGVAASISGERAWSESPLTVRELFARSARPEALRPLLLPFEEASYGHRAPDAAMYVRAVDAAAPYRVRAA